MMPSLFLRVARSTSIKLTLNPECIHHWIVDQELNQWSHLREKLRMRAKYYIPALSWIPKYNVQQLPYDIVAGATGTAKITLGCSDGQLLKLHCF
jgi:hypothetical protein